MANQYVNKVGLGNEILIDLTADTVVANRLFVGLTAHGADGAPIVGTFDWEKQTPLYYDYNIGFVDNGVWKYENPTRTYTDIYQVQTDHTYFISLGRNKGTRFRAMFTTQDVTTKTSGSVSGRMIINVNNPAALANTIYRVPSDGYIIVAKDNIGTSGLFSYVFDCSEVFNAMLADEDLQ